MIDRLHLLLRCHACSQQHAKRVNVVMKHSPECPHCIHMRRMAAVERLGVTFAGYDPDKRKYGHFILPCSHQVNRQFSRVEKAADGGHALSCETCRELLYAAQSGRFGWQLFGPATNAKPGYRSYRHTCGHMQNVSVGNMVWGACACAGCSPHRTSKPSYIYLFRIGLPNLSVIKLGYSVRPEKRLRHQLGIAKDVETEVIRAIRLPTGHLARAEEEQCHANLRRHHPAWEIPKAIFGDAINTMSEIYAPDAEAVIMSMLDQIETQHSPLHV